MNALPHHADSPSPLLRTLLGSVSEMSSDPNDSASLLKAKTQPDCAALVSEGQFHGVLPLLGLALRRRDLWRRLPDGWQDLEAAIRAASRTVGVQELSWEPELRRVGEALEEAGLEGLIIKGHAMALSHYPEPGLRPRCDVDLLVPPAIREAVLECFDALDYATRTGVDGDMISRQRCLYRHNPAGPDYVIDLHWKLTNRPSLDRALDYPFLAEQCLPLADLPRSLRRPDDLRQLLVTALHRVAHHRHEWRLIWLYDVDLLARGLSEAQWARLAPMAIERGLAAVTVDALRAAAEIFATPLPEAVREQLEGAPAEPSARLLSPESNPLESIWLEWRALTGFRRWRLLWQHAFPSAEYMRRRYPVGSSLSLPWWYLRRGFLGLRRSLRQR